MASDTTADSVGQGVLLVNLGSPESPETGDVRRYLRQFLSDPRVLDIPAPVRQTILNLFILPFRPRSSGEAYESIWTEEGSPLIVTTYRVADMLQERLGEVPVEVAMRYGNPSTAAGLRRLRSRGVRDVFVIPMYPHYAMSSYETAVAHVQDVARDQFPKLQLTFQPPFYDDPDYIEGLLEVARPYLEDEDSWDHVLFSYHGVPERHIRKGDPSGCYCLEYENCCQRTHPAQAMCYRHQCFATTWAVAARAGLDAQDYSVSFQSRLGTDPWLEPFTDKTLERLPSRGVKKLLIVCPAFVSDCLETLEEINIEGREIFMDAGGTHFSYIPCLNDHPRFVDLLERFYRDFAAPAQGPGAAKSAGSEEPRAAE